MKKWHKIVLACIIIAVLMSNPVTRPIILFIIPMGFGVWDLISIAAIAIALIIIFYKAVFYAVMKIAIPICSLFLPKETLEDLEEIKNKFKRSKRHEKNH